MNNININIVNNINDVIFSFQYSFNDNTEVKELLLYLYDKLFQNDYEERINLYMCFSFIKNDEIKGKLDYKLRDFLDNFGFDYDNVKMKYYDGVGGHFYCGGIARMEIHEAEQNHYHTPHIHVYNPNKSKSSQTPVIISLKSFEIIKGKEIWNETYKSKERKIMIQFLMNNQEKLIDAYNIMRKGAYLPYDFFLDYFGTKTKIEQRKNY